MNSFPKKSKHTDSTYNCLIDMIQKIIFWSNNFFLYATRNKLSFIRVLLNQYPKRYLRKNVSLGRLFVLLQTNLKTRMYVDIKVH